GLLRRFACVAALGFGLAATVLAAPLAETLEGATPAELQSLRDGATLMRYAESPDALRLLPRGSEGDYVGRAAAARPAAFLVECAFLVKGTSLAGDDRVRAFNKLTEVESLAPVTYYSELRDRQTPLFRDPRRVVGPGATEAVAHVGVAEAPTSAGFDLYFHDANFGPSWFRVEIDGGGSGFTVALTNSRPLGIALLRAFPAGGLRMRFALVPVDEGVLVCGICAAEPSPGTTLLVDLWSAMEKRLNAVKGWVAGRIGGDR
ncbi:MAG: hypothetical protein JNG85_16695, partial [Spirochaetaceae bacterium]|nr:hypothetical protein [Spirochaetaceae bacterium]